MFGARDVAWSLLICAVLTLLVDCRPAWSARRFIEREAKAGFLDAYAGYRMLNGEVIASGKGGTHVDPLAPLVLGRSLDFNAQRVSWTGQRAEFVVRHAVDLQGLDPAGSDAAQEVHVQIEKRGPIWVYTRFAVRGRGELADPNTGNPWAVAFKPG